MSTSVCSQQLVVKLNSFNLTTIFCISTILSVFPFNKNYFKSVVYSKNMF